MNAPRPDAELLAAFAGRADQTAFAELVERHGPMVVRVAEAILRDRHGAEDVAQAAFLVLARKAAGLRRSETVAPWLHRVAWRLAIDELRRRQSRQRREEENVRMNTPAPPADLSAVHEELGALPDRYRSALVLCYLEGEPQESAARRLGLSAAALRKRLDRGRELLRKKLVRRGVTVGSVGALTALLSAESGAAVLPATFVASTVSAATGGAVSTTVAALSKGALHMLFIAKLKTASLTAAACLVVAGTGVVVAKQVTGTATPVAAPVVNQPAPIQMAQNNPTATAPVTPPASAGTENNPPTVQPKVEPGVFMLRVTRLTGCFGPGTVFHTVVVTEIESLPPGATEPKVGDKLMIGLPDNAQNRKVFLPDNPAMQRSNCRVNLVRHREFPNVPDSKWMYRFPNDFPANNLGDCQETPVPETRDATTGITVKAEWSQITAYAADKRRIWAAERGCLTTSLTIENGRVIAQPGNAVYDLQTGKALGKVE